MRGLVDRGWLHPLGETKESKIGHEVRESKISFFTMNKSFRRG